MGVVWLLEDRSSHWNDHGLAWSSMEKQVVRLVGAPGGVVRVFWRRDFSSVPKSFGSPDPE